MWLKIDHQNLAFSTNVGKFDALPALVQTDCVNATKERLLHHI